MAQADKNKAEFSANIPVVAEPVDRRDEGDRLAALYGLTPKVESAVIAAIVTDANIAAKPKSILYAPRIVKGSFLFISDKFSFPLIYKTACKLKDDK